MEHEQEQQQKTSLVLPVSVVGRIDAGRLLREAEALDDFLKQATIREPGTPVKLPKTSRLLDETIEANQLNVLHEDERIRLLEFLHSVKEHAPIIHVSFSADPSPLFTGKLMAWMRREIHPLILMQVGLQPNIGAGVIVRTTNQHFDFSLRQRFLGKREELTKLLSDNGHKGEAAEAQPEQSAQPQAPQPQTAVPSSAPTAVAIEQPQLPAVQPAAPVEAPAQATQAVSPPQEVHS